MKIPEISEFLILLYTQNRELGNLANFSFTSNFDSSCNQRFENNKTFNWDNNWKFTIWFKNKKWTFPRFPNFRFLSITRIENSEFSEIFCPSNFDTGCNGRFKNDKKWAETKTKKFSYDLEEKWKFPKFLQSWTKYLAQSREIQ